MNPVGSLNILQNEFNTFIHMYKRLLIKLNQDDRNLANKWVTKLSAFNARLSDMRLRNAIMNSLIMQMQMGVLTAPFNTHPRFTSLDQVQPITKLTAESVLPEGFKLPKIMQQSPDQGAFLINQPVPKCGAFCYLAVVSRPTNN